MKKRIKKLQNKIKKLEGRLEDAQAELSRLEDEEYEARTGRPSFNEILCWARERHPVARITRYKGFGDIDSPDFKMVEESEEIPWTRYYKEVRRSAMSQYGIKRIPRRFILSQFEQDVPPETAAQIIKKNVENGYMKAVIIDGTHLTQ